MFATGGPLERLAETNDWLSDFKDAQASFGSAFAALNRVRYFGTEQPVELGDHVTICGLFSRRSARVAYVPGSSPENPEIDFGGLFRIGMRYGARFTMWHIAPDSLELKIGVRFVKSGSESVPGVPSVEELNA